MINIRDKWVFQPDGPHFKIIQHLEDYEVTYDELTRWAGELRARIQREQAVLRGMEEMLEIEILKEKWS